MIETQKHVRVDLQRDPSGEPVLHIDATFPVAGPYSLQLPTWRPGRYELGQFAQYIRRIEGQLADGTWQQLQKSDLHLWDVPAGVHRVRWAFHADILNAGSTCVMEDLLYVNPVNCMLYNPDGMDWSYQLNLTDVPSDWMIGTALPKVDGHFIARDVQHLMDSPFMASPTLWHAEYTSHGIPFYLWAYGQQTPEKERFISDHQRFTDCQIDHFGSFPAPAYHFLYLFPEREARHGVEHEDSTVIALGPSAMCLTKEGYDELIGIASHELYHAWNVKRIRPAEWMPYDFSRACPSRLGYIAEGVTTYMGDLFLFESGCIDLEQWCRLTEKLLMRHINNPGRLNMSVAESSYDTWLDGYQMGVPGRKGSIYVEGAVLALLCDVRIMQLTGSQYSLQMAMRILWEQYGQDRIGITAEDYWSVLNEVAGAPEALADLREKHAYGCEETWDELTAAMEWQGLKLTQSMGENGLKRVQLSPLED